MIKLVLLRQLITLYIHYWKLILQWIPTL